MRRTRGSVMAIVGLAFLALLAHSATAGCSAARFFRCPRRLSHRASNRIIPLASDAPQAKTRRKANQVGADITGSIEKLVSREEQPVTIEPPKSAPRSLPLRVGVPAAPIPTNAALAAATDPREPPPTVAVASQRVGQPVAADVRGAAPAQVGAASTGPAEANSPAAATPRVIGSRYAVQVTSERSESNAQAALLALQAKYPNQLSGRQLIIRRAVLGAKGTYYRVFVGPFASVEEAARWCSKLKAAGGNCIVQTS